jgi:ketosteroid isomerase-like protein
MTIQIQAVAEAFSSHRFADSYPHLADDVSWVTPGAPSTDGRAAVIAACENTLAELADTTTEFTRFVSVAGAEAAAVDAVGRYTGPDGSTSVVSSCDIYEFTGDLLTRITSYAVELPADQSGTASAES